MRRPRRQHHVWWGVVAVLPVAAGSLQGTLSQSAAPEPVRVLFPADQCALESGKFDLLCVAPGRDEDAASGIELRVDGKAERWEPYRAPVLLAQLDLPPGRHEITIGPKRLRVEVRGDAKASEVAREWPVYRSHPRGGKPKDCATCHEVTTEEGRTVVGRAKEPSACLQCHSPTDFEVAHFHPRGPLSTCRNCHALHGSARSALLKAPTKQLCTACHD